MRIKKILLIAIIIFGVCGCTNIDRLSYDEIINETIVLEKNPNTFKGGFKYYQPKGISAKEAGSNYVILNSYKLDYYLYVDLVSYINKTDLNYKENSQAKYSKMINYNNKKGYIEINFCKNNQYLIEIMYNYAKIEVMVDEGQIKEALIKSINILSSVKYDDIIINNLLNDDNLDYTEEIFDMFKDRVDNSNVLNQIDENDSSNNDIDNDEIKDTDYIN